MSKKPTVKTLSLAITLALPVFMNSPVFAGDKANTGLTTLDEMATPSTTSALPLDVVLNKVLGKPASRSGLIKTDKQVYYVGNSITLKVTLPNSLKPLLTSAAEAQIVMYLPDGELIAFPVAETGNGNLYESVIDDAASLPAGVYQLALVLVKTGGDATHVTDWYGGLGALISVTRVKISEAVGSDDEDLNGDGLIDEDSDGNGFVDEVTDNDGSTEGSGSTEDDEDNSGDDTTEGSTVPDDTADACTADMRLHGNCMPDADDIDPTTPTGSNLPRR